MGAGSLPYVNEKYPICGLMRDIFAKSGLKPSEFVHQQSPKIGLKSLTKYVQKFYDGLGSGCFEQAFLDSVANNYPGKAGQLRKTVEKTNKIFEKEAKAMAEEVERKYEKDFKPSIQIIRTSSRPKMLMTFFALCGLERIKYLPLNEEEQALPPSKLLGQFPALLERKKRERSNDWRLGESQFGKLTGFRYQFAPYEYYDLDRNGKVLSKGEGRPSLYPDNWVTYKGKRLPTLYNLHKW